MDATASSRRFEPVITIFHCEHGCGGVLTAPGVGGSSRLVPCCAVDVDARRIREAFLEGADGVLILGCLGGACCMPRNDVEAFLHIHAGALALHRLGVDPARLQRNWMMPSEASRVPALVAAFRRRVVVLGPRFESRTPHPDPVPSPVPAAAEG